MNTENNLWDIPLVVKIGRLKDERLLISFRLKGAHSQKAYLRHPDTPDEFQEMIDILSLLVSMFAFLPN